MVFGWLFGEKRKQEDGTVLAQLAQADAATQARDFARGEALCRGILKADPDVAEAWSMLGVNLIRRGIGDPELRAEAVIAWMRVLALRPGDSRAADHVRAEIQFPEEIVPRLISRLGDPAPTCDDTAAALAQIGEPAKAALELASRSSEPGAERARALLANIS
jgi:hypothetical protein